MTDTTANTKPIFQLRPKTTGMSFTDADTTVAKTIFTAGAEGSLVDNISVTTDDTTDVILILSINDGVNSFQIGEVTIVAGSGTDGVLPAVNLLNDISMPFLQTAGGIPINALYLLKVAAKSTMTAAKVLDVVSFGGDY